MASYFDYKVFIRAKDLQNAMAVCASLPAADEEPQIESISTVSHGRYLVACQGSGKGNMDCYYSLKAKSATYDCQIISISWSEEAGFAVLEKYDNGKETDKEFDLWDEDRDYESFDMSDADFDAEFGPFVATGAAAQQPEEAVAAPPAAFVIRTGAVSEIRGHTEELRIPNGVKEIAHDAFLGCRELKKLILPASVEYFFSVYPGSATGIEAIEVAKGNPHFASKDGVLFNKDFTELCIFPPARTGEYTIPPTVRKLSPAAFQSTLLTKLILSSAIEDVPTCCFEYSKTLSELSISTHDAQSDASIPRYVAKDGILYNSDMTELLCCPPARSGKLVIPESMQRIHERAFWVFDGPMDVMIQDSLAKNGGNKIGIEAFEVEEANPYFSAKDGVLFNKDFTEICMFPPARTGEYTIPPTVRRLSPTAFWRASLTRLIFSSALEDVHAHYFRKSKTLSEFAVSTQDAHAGASLPCYAAKDGVLYNSDMTELFCCPPARSGKLVIPEGVRRIREKAFKEIDGLTEILVPDGVTKIGKAAFSECKNLRSVRLPASLIRISPNTFSECRALTELKIPDSVTAIGGTAFRNCSSLTELKIPDGVTKIVDNTFDRCVSLTEIKIPDGVTKIGEFAFYGCKSLTEIKIPDGVTEIGQKAFAECRGLREVYLSASLSEIKDFTFDNCTALTTVLIPDSVTKICSFAFNFCEALTELVLPGGVTEIGEYNAFPKTCTLCVPHGSRTAVTLRNTKYKRTKAIPNAAK